MALVWAFDQDAELGLPVEHVLKERLGFVDEVADVALVHMDVDHVWRTIS